MEQSWSSLSNAYCRLRVFPFLGKPQEGKADIQKTKLHSEIHSMPTDFVTLWKLGSILLTGAFGVLGLVTEFKDKDSRKITKWGIRDDKFNVWPRTGSTITGVER